MLFFGCRSFQGRFGFCKTIYIPYHSLPVVKLPCEIIVSKILPQVRAMVAVELRERYNLQGKIIAAMVGTTEAAVSQYIHGVRAVKKEFLKDFPEIPVFSREVAKELYERQDEDIELMMKMGMLCEAVRNNKNFNKLLNQASEDCKFCSRCDEK